MPHSFISPDSIAGFEECRFIDRAALLKDYAKELEEEMYRVDIMIRSLLMQANTVNDIDNDRYKLVVKYKTGMHSVPNLMMLKDSFPEKYDQLYQTQVATFKPSLTKTDVAWLFADKPEDAIKVMIDCPIPTQYQMTAKKEAKE